MSDQKLEMEGQVAQSSQEKNRDNDEISLLDLVAVLWKRKWLVIAITGLVAFGSLAYSIGSLLMPPDKSYLPNVYTPKATMLISSGTTSSLSSLLSSSGLSGLQAWQESQQEAIRISSLQKYWLLPTQRSIG